MKQQYILIYFVPHIYANNAIGAMTALLIMFTRRQMELMRRIAPGRLSFRKSF
jgi:hypothetical protein